MQGERDKVCLSLSTERGRLQRLLSCPWSGLKSLPLDPLLCNSVKILLTYSCLGGGGESITLTASPLPPMLVHTFSFTLAQAGVCNSSPLPLGSGGESPCLRFLRGHVFSVTRTIPAAGICFQTQSAIL